jgi:hypothetical protein
MIHLIVQLSKSGFRLKERKVFYLFLRKLKLKLIGTIKGLQLFAIALIEGFNFLEFEIHVEKKLLRDKRLALKYIRL